MITEIECPMCGDSAELEIEPCDWDAWRSGMLIQEAFPYLSADDRERLMTGTCKDCWDKMFSDEEEFGAGIWK